MIRNYLEIMVNSAPAICAGLHQERHTKDKAEIFRLFCESANCECKIEVIRHHYKKVSMREELKKYGKNGSVLPV